MTPFPPPSPLGALNINKLFRKWAIGKEVVTIQIKKFPLSLRNWYLTKRFQKANNHLKNKSTPQSLPLHCPPSKGKKKDVIKIGCANCCRITSFPASVISLNDVYTEAYAFMFIGEIGTEPCFCFSFYLDFLLKLLGQIFKDFFFSYWNKSLSLTILYIIHLLIFLFIKIFWLSIINTLCICADLSLYVTFLIMHLHSEQMRTWWDQIYAFNSSAAHVLKDS